MDEEAAFDEVAALVDVAAAVVDALVVEALVAEDAPLRALLVPIFIALLAVQGVTYLLSSTGSSRRCCIGRWLQRHR